MDLRYNYFNFIFAVTTDFSCYHLLSNNFRNLGFSYNPQVPSFPSNVLLFGETYVRQTNWEQSLEVCDMRLKFKLF